MSILSNREIICECGETFEKNLWSAVSVSDNPELKEYYTEKISERKSIITFESRMAEIEKIL